MELYYNEILLALMVAVTILLILILILSLRISRMNKRYRKVIGNATVEHVDDLLISIQDKLAGLNEVSKQNTDALEGIRKIMKKMKSKVAIRRYNAFSQQGSELSFSVAILDDEQDGVVLTGIHSREETYIYAKPVDKGGSTYALSPEEKEVIALSVGVKR